MIILCAAQKASVMLPTYWICYWLAISDRSVCSHTMWARGEQLSHRAPDECSGDQEDSLQYNYQPRKDRHGDSVHSWKAIV